jgi:hypothetical protein
VPDIGGALKEIERVMTPGGYLVSTFPFDPSRESTLTKARLVDGNIEHLMEPEYHGNPVRATEGSLVFQSPGWDIIETCESAGFAKAQLIFVASSRYGISSNGIPGVFVLVAQKGGVDQVINDLRPLHNPHSGKNLGIHH